MVRHNIQQQLQINSQKFIRQVQVGVGSSPLYLASYRAIATIPCRVAAQLVCKYSYTTLLALASRSTFLYVSIFHVSIFVVIYIYINIFYIIYIYRRYGKYSLAIQLQLQSVSKYYGGFKKCVLKFSLCLYTMLRTDNIASRKFFSLFLNISRRRKGRETQNCPNSSFSHNFCH